MRILTASLVTIASISLVTLTTGACKSKSSSDSAAGAGNQSPEQMFRSFQDQLVATCGGVQGACHVQGTHKNAQGQPAAQWLGPNDPYQAAKNYVGIIPITGDPGDSKLLTQVEHDGPALVSTPDLFENVKKWVTAEVAAAGNVRAVTDAFYIKDGPNTVSLAKLAQGADGAQLTFNAATLGDNLFLDSMQITAPTGKGLVVDTATFIILPASGPTQTDALSGFTGPLNVAAGKTVPFYSGSTQLLKWNSLNRAKLVFNSFALSSGQADGGGGGTPGCKALDVFTAKAAPAFKEDLGDGKACVNCHGVNPQKSGDQIDLALQTLDLRTLDAAPAQACAETLAHVSLTNQAQSEIILTCKGEPGGDEGHPVQKICGAVVPDSGPPAFQCVPQTVVDGIQAWINAEN